MGTGKTSVGKILAKRLGRPVVDVDQWVEQKEQRRISDIFEKEGEPHFRALEREAIRQAAQKEGVVITTGGGAVIDPINVEALKATGILVALSSRPETIFKRVKNSRHRPLLKGSDVFSEIQRLLEIRKPFYEKADFHFETDGKSSTQVAGMIMKALHEKL